MGSHMKALKDLSFPFWSLPVALFLLGIIAYGIHISWMGFYWDDWPWIWFSQVMGPAGMLRIDVEHRLTILTRWIVDADRRGEDYGLRLPGQAFPPAHGTAQRLDCLEALALFGKESAHA